MCSIYQYISFKVVNYCCTHSFVVIKFNVSQKQCIFMMGEEGEKFINEVKPLINQDKQQVNFENSWFVYVRQANNVIGA